MKARKFCPKCGHPVLKSQIKGYAFQCFACDEDFYRHEVYSLKDRHIVRKIQRTTYFYELTDRISLPPASVKKPYRRPQPTKHQKVNDWCEHCEEHNYIVRESYLMENTIEKWWKQLCFKDMEAIIGLRETDFDPSEGSRDFVDACNEAWDAKNNEEKIDIWRDQTHDTSNDE